MATHKELFETLVEEVKKSNSRIDKKEEMERRRWENSPFLSLREIHSNKLRGEILSELMLALIKLQGFDVEIRARINHESSMIIIGKGIGQMQVKTSLLPQAGNYTFQQIRKVDNFDALIFFGISPHEAHWWVVNRGVIIDNLDEWIKRKNLNVQHRDVDKMVTFNVKRVPQWLVPLGGKLDKGLEVFKKEVERLEEIKQSS